MSLWDEPPGSARSCAGRDTLRGVLRSVDGCGLFAETNAYGVRSVHVTPAIAAGLASDPVVSDGRVRAAATH